MPLFRAAVPLNRTRKKLEVHNTGTTDRDHRSSPRTRCPWGVRDAAQPNLVQLTLVCSHHVSVRVNENKDKLTRDNSCFLTKDNGAPSVVTA